MSCVRAKCQEEGIELDAMYTEDILTGVADLLKQANESGEKVSMLDAIKTKLEAACIGWYGHVQPDRAGVSPHNRSKLGVVGADSQFLGKEILDIGWSWRKCSDSSAFEIPPAPWDKEAK